MEKDKEQEQDITEIAREFLIQKSEEVMRDLQTRPVVQEVVAPAILAFMAIRKSYESFKSGGYSQRIRGTRRKSRRRPRPMHRPGHHNGSEAKAA